MNHILTQHLAPVAKRYRWRQVCITLTICWLLAALIGLGMLIANRTSGWYSTTMIPSTIVVFATLLRWLQSCAAICCYRLFRSVKNFRLFTRTFEELVTVV